MADAGLVGAALFAVPGLIWSAITAQSWVYVLTRQPRSLLFRMLPLATGLTTLHCLLGVAGCLTPPAHPLATWLRLGRDASALAGVAVFRHVLCYLPADEERPGRAWLVTHYGLTIAVIVITTGVRLLAGSPELVWLAVIAFWLVVLAMSALCLGQVARMARGRGFGPGGMAEMRRPDVVVIAAGLAVSGGLFVAFGLFGWRGDGGITPVLADVAISAAAAVPVAMRMLGQVVRRVLIAAITMATTATLLVAHTAVAARVDPALGPLVAVCAVLVLTVLLVPGHAWLATAVDRAVFRRRRRRFAELEDFLRGLTPEVGILESCRRVAAEIGRVLQVPGVGILLADGPMIVAGELFAQPIERVWPRGPGADRLPRRAFDTATLRELPETLRDALVEANVGLGVYPIVSPSGRRGHLFLSTGRFGITGEDDVTSFEAFAAQLALVLDGAELLARAVAVERSLAHAEKLAAIGELAARMAHEIRNPVTAARSLAQQLCREPASPLNAESASLILTELERVERQVAALLSFARREELRREVVDVSDLARSTAESFRARCDAAGVELGIEAAPHVVARGDRERLRQVLINLIENALDALGDVSGRRRLAIAVGTVNGSAVLRVSDSGPGIAADVLPRVFEPFFSQKASGTGLGLAIARRTIEAHGGRITVAAAEGEGASFAIELPLGGGEPA